MYEFLVANNEASALVAITSVSVAFLAFVTSVVSIYISASSLKHQQKHDVLSVSPIPEIIIADYEHSLQVKIMNKGSGPLIIKDFSVLKDSESKSSIIAWMGNLPKGRLWTNFAENVEDCAIMPGEYILLLELSADSESEKPDFSESRNLCRLWLRNLTCQVVYTNVYETHFPPYIVNLSWFGRNI